jgi:hypothetical protein
LGKCNIFLHRVFFAEGEGDPWKIYNRLANEILSNVIAFRRQHLCPFHFHLFCFEANINIQFPHPFTPTRTPSIQVFHYFCLSLFAGWPTSVLPFRCLFLGGKYLETSGSDNTCSNVKSRKYWSGFDLLTLTHCWRLICQQNILLKYFPPKNKHRNGSTDVGQPANKLRQK